MMGSYIYLGAMLIELAVLLSITFYILSLVFSAFMGSPYVPTKGTQIEEMLKPLKLKKGMTFLELGCGDGRVLCEAAKKYKVSGLGIDINPFVLWQAKRKAKKMKLSTVRFENKNIFNLPVSGYDVVYLFLMPSLIQKLTSKFKKEAQKNTIFVSHGFKIDGWDKYNYLTLERNPFSTYYYRI